MSAQNPDQAIIAPAQTAPAQTGPAQTGPPAFKYVLAYHSVPGYAPLAWRPPPAR